MGPASPSLPRFFVADPAGSVRLTLSREESRHALRVLRLRPGDAMILFDGMNREHSGRLEAVKGGLAVVVVESTEVVDREARAEVTLAVAVPKGRRLEDLVRGCAELGVATVVPIFTRRGVVREQPDRGGQRDRGGPRDCGGRVARLERVALEAAKQCGRNRLTRIGAPCSFADHLALARDHDVALLATTAPGTVSLTNALTPPLRRGKILLTIGPEGGFDPEEIASAIGVGFRPVTLGRSRLRVSTAAVAGVAMILALADDGGNGGAGRN